MKTIIAFALLLGLTIGGFSYVVYQQHQQITDLQFQVSVLHSGSVSLQSQVNALQSRIGNQEQVSDRQKRSLSTLRSQEVLDEEAIVKIIDFLTTPEPQTKPNNVPRS